MRFRSLLLVSFIHKYSNLKQSTLYPHAKDNFLSEYFMYARLFTLENSYTFEVSEIFLVDCVCLCTWKDLSVKLIFFPIYMHFLYDEA